ncbi:hypothetical protein BVC80_9101g136 [Macleaya cordata]|uniref:Morc S5 domain-containing protein n=1 Tax=Macleaya cordata TaxID=56857 RepID=A0A200QGJ5_MACCD|nr:hypothetical protein BVC80_9101g136 [Macleaya cordata]
MASNVKQEIVEPGTDTGNTFVKVNHPPPSSDTSKLVPIIDLSSSSSEDDSDDSGDSDEDSTMMHGGKRSRVSNGQNGASCKKQKLDKLGIVLPLGFLDPLPPEDNVLPLPVPVPKPRNLDGVQSCKQFWKAGDYDGGMDHVRVHPKFLHSNATSHKWALGAFAELLDNSLDEVCHGATFVNIDMLRNIKDGNRMLLVEDNGGGMDPDKMRQCMSLGYSAKSKIANTIGQYGNGFKTSTMRLGADVIVFSRCRGKDGKSSTQSVGLLSYTFLRSTGKEDIVVPMLDYEKEGRVWNKLMRSSSSDWTRNVETIVQWSPYASEADLLHQFNTMTEQGTRVIIYNLWEDDQGELELDFDSDRRDIQIRGVNRDEKKIEMAKQFPNSRHFLTYRHSLRSYASILYLRLPLRFRMVLRGKDIVHHNIVNDMMLTQEVTYRPQPGADGVPKDPNMVATVTIGFVKDAKDHIDVQGFNVYHKNRLIKPFWRVWNAAGSDGRGVIGVLEANFVEPAHDKQGFERTTVLARLEARLVQMQKTYWSSNCHKIGYAPRRQKKLLSESAARDSSPDEYIPQSSSRNSRKSTSSLSWNPKHGNGHAYSKGENGRQSSTKFQNKSSYPEPTSPVAEDDSECDMPTVAPKRTPNSSSQKASPAPKSFAKDSSNITPSFSQNSNNSEFEQDRLLSGRADRIATRSQLKGANVTCNGNGNSQNSNDPVVQQLKMENSELKDRLNKMKKSFLRDIEYERDRVKSLEAVVNEDAPTNSDPDCLKRLQLENHELKDRLKKVEEAFSHDLRLEREKCNALQAKLEESKRKIEEMSKEQEALIDIFSEERSRRDNEEENLRKKLKDASTTIQELLDKVRLLEKMKSPNVKP